MKLPVSNSTIIYLIVPMSILLSALLRSVHYMRDGWAFGRQRSCKTISKGFLRIPAPNSVFTMAQMEETGPSGEAQRLQDDVVVDFRNILQKAKSVKRKKVQK